MLPWIPWMHYKMHTSKQIIIDHQEQNGLPFSKCTQYYWGFFCSFVKAESLQKVH